MIIKPPVTLKEHKAVLSTIDELIANPFCEGNMLSDLLRKKALIEKDIAKLQSAYTIEEAIQNALDEASLANDKGNFYKADDCLESHDWSKGDPETIHSIASCYQDDDNNDGTWEDKILGALSEKYPKHF